MFKRLLLLCVGMAVIPAGFGAAKSKAQVPAGGYMPLTQACVLEEGVSLGPNFKGHSLIGVVAAIGNIPPKDQYETNDEFKMRTENVLSTKPSALRDGHLCVISAGARLTDDFDADAQVLRVRTLGTYSSRWFDGEEFHDIAKVYGGERNVRRSVYDASNAYGVSVSVTKTKRDAYYVAFDKQSVVEAGGLPGLSHKELSLRADVEMSGADARAQKDDIDVVYLYSVVRPYVGSHSEYEFPKIDWPFESEEKQTLVIASLKKLAVINVRTGLILKVFDLAGQQHSASTSSKINRGDLRGMGPSSIKKPFVVK
ncbi:hypothetical protein ACNPM2_03835 [Stenotrophomonas geniculata]|uniref:hypothetical protein n=1 Tax=Stenotrophomonas geniculata TaxID=86188 RepID=UPI003AAEF269